MTKHNGSTWKIISIIFGIITIIAIYIWQAAGIAGNVEVNHNKIEEMKPIVLASEKAIIGIEKDISHLAQKVEENSVTQRQILVLQHDILREVKK